MGSKEKEDVKVDEVVDEKVKGRKCFIITPIGSSNDAIFRHINGVIQSVIRPVLKDYGFSDVRAAHEISDPGSINNQLVNRIVDDDLVIANLTGKNPNVMYELCLRHAVAKPVIHICEEGTNLPFDIKGERTIFYTNDMYGSEELKTELTKALKSISYDKEYKDNPIYSAIQIGNILKTGDNDKIDANSLILREIQRLSQEVSALNIDGNGNTTTTKTLKLRSYSNTFTILINSGSQDEIELFGMALLKNVKSFEVARLETSSDMSTMFLSFINPVDSEKIKRIINMEALARGIQISIVK